MRYFVLLLTGLVLGVILRFIETRNVFLKQWIRAVLNYLFLFSFIIIIVGYGLFLNVYLLDAGLFILIPTFAAFLVRQTFIYVKWKRSSAHL
ncbi:hypothetical protein GWK91_02045 [Virgibacillus sp. MSP4-1]|uniref:hypothetical protein n=1 Tax=Virgibacillus sp. MSP4-1 TaxID=2700081 RepID=UPI0005C49E4C|nr:hypothetical protein [Virgibacillus sp. MSP4-1]QHS21799.1 hypothetical protein GWK91_02045 [Virgibacillus sp. MSP4-1]